MIGTPTYALPSWLAQKDPDVLVTAKDGRANYGHRQLINLWNPTFRLCAERVIRKMVSHTAGMEKAWACADRVKHRQYADFDFFKYKTVKEFG